MHIVDLLLWGSFLVANVGALLGRERMAIIGLNWSVGLVASTLAFDGYVSLHWLVCVPNSPRRGACENAWSP